MRALYKKETLQDPEKEGHTYTNHTLLRETEFCCVVGSWFLRNGSV